jgi:hypothetical protein
VGVIDEYPQELSGKDILLEARVLTVADVVKPCPLIDLIDQPWV